MSKEELHQIAEKDTPEAVSVPDTWKGLIAWATIRFGLGIVVAIVFGLMTKEVYRDMRSDRTELLNAYIQNISAVHNNADALKAVVTEIRSQTDILTAQKALLERHADQVEELLKQQQP